MRYPELTTIHQPASLGEALRLLRDGGPTTRVIAGGTSRVLWNQRGVSTLIDLWPLGLTHIESKNGVIRIEAGVTMAELARSPVIQGIWGGILSQAAARTAATPLRNLITVGGTIAALFPWSDLPVALLCTDAVVVIAGEGERRVPLTSFVTEPGKRLHAHELIVAVELSEGDGVRGEFIKFTRSDFDYALVDVAATARVVEGRLANVSLAVGAAAGLPQRMTAVERAVEGLPADDVAFKAVVRETQNAIKPRHDVRASAEYLREIAGVLAGRALQSAIVGGRQMAGEA